LVLLALDDVGRRPGQQARAELIDGSGEITGRADPDIFTG
jgi:hypothetical protein